MPAERPALEDCLECFSALMGTNCLKLASVSCQMPCFQRHRARTKTPFRLDVNFTLFLAGLCIVGRMVGGRRVAGNHNIQTMGAQMRVEVEVLGQVEEPYHWINEEHALGLQLRAGSIEAGVHRSMMRRLTFE